MEVSNLFHPYVVQPLPRRTQLIQFGRGIGSNNDQALGYRLSSSVLLHLPYRWALVSWIVHYQEDRPVSLEISPRFWSPLRSPDRGRQIASPEHLNND